MKRCTALVLAVVLMTTGCQNSGKSIFGQKFAEKTAFFNDQSVIMNVSMSLAKDKPLWKNSHINMLHHNKSLLLVGQTSSKEYKDQSERIASNIDGISKIYNQLSVREPISYAQRAKDAWLTTQIKAKFFAEKKIGFNDVKVITENNRVYLMGTLSKDNQEIAVKIVSAIDDVVEVLKIFDEPTNSQKSS